METEYLVYGLAKGETERYTESLLGSRSARLRFGCANESQASFRCRGFKSLKNGANFRIG